jgi:hypothetical protein
LVSYQNGLAHVGGRHHSGQFSRKSEKLKRQLARFAIRGTLQ